MDALDGAGAREQAQSAKLAATAQQVAAGCLSAATVAASAALIAIVAKRDGDPAAELRQIRSNSGIATALEHDVRSARGQAFLLLSDALWLGFQTGAGRADGLPLTVALDDSDRAALFDYPILGHTCSEVADDLATKLRWEVDTALGQPLTTVTDPQTIPAALATVAAAHAQRLAGAVDEAYHAGVQAAVRGIGAALTGTA